MRTLPTALACVILAGVIGAVETPRVTAVTPSPLFTSPKSQTLKVTGTGFAPGLIVEVMSQGNTETYSGAAVQGQRSTTFEIAVVLAQPGAAMLLVRNTDGGVSDPFPLKVNVGPAGQPEPPVPQSRPTIDRVSPDRLTKGTVAQAVTLSGSQFAPGLTVAVTDPTGTVTVVKGTALDASTPTLVKLSLIFDVSGEYTLAIINPPGQSSNTVTVSVS